MYIRHLETAITHIIVPLSIYTLCFGLQGLGTKELINRFLFMLPVACSQSYKLNFFGNVLLL